MYLGLRQCGSLNLAQTKDRMIALKRRIAYNSPTGLHCEVKYFFLLLLYIYYYLMDLFILT